MDLLLWAAASRRAAPVTRLTDSVTLRHKFVKPCLAGSRPAARLELGALVRWVVPADSTRSAMQIFGFVDGYLGLILVLSAMQLPLALWIPSLQMLHHVFDCIVEYCLRGCKHGH